MAPGRFGFTVSYAASGGGARTDAALRIDADATAWMFLGSPMSLPPAGELATVGSFAGRPTARRLRELAGRLAALGSPEPPVPAPPGSVVRFLRVAAAGQDEQEWAVPGYPSAPVAAVEQALQRIMVDLVRSPAAALRLEAGPDGAYRLLAAGAEPVQIPRPGSLRGTLVARDSQGAVLATAPIAPPAAADVLVLAPGESLTLTADRPATVGAADWSGGVELDIVAGERPRHVLVPVT